MNACVDIKIHLYCSRHGRVHDDQRLCRWLWDPHYWHWDHPNVALRGVLFWQKVETTRRSILGSDCEELIVQSSKRPETILRQSLLKYVLYAPSSLELRERRGNIFQILLIKWRLKCFRQTDADRLLEFQKVRLRFPFLNFPNSSWLRKSSG